MSAHGATSISIRYSSRSTERRASRASSICITWCGAHTSIRRRSTAWSAVFDAVGMLDAALSVARWRRELPHWCTPELTGAATSLDAELVAHPLLETPVANSLATHDTNVLITGSNMSGKTTFVRTLGVNAVLAQTLNTAYAARWHAPFLAVRTSIGRDDSLVEGRSYYLAEVASVLALIRARDDGRQHLFLLDEIYRGTNTTERVAAARAVLAHLALGDDIVVVATHDVELIEMLEESYAPYHFREQIERGSLEFDYRIRPGPSSTRNAIALLELMHYPESIIAAALAGIEWRETAIDRPDRVPD